MWNGYKLQWLNYQDTHVIEWMEHAADRNSRLLYATIYY